MPTGEFAPSILAARGLSQKSAKNELQPVDSASSSLVVLPPVGQSEPERKSKRDPLAEENLQLRRETQRLTEELRKAEVVIDIQNKVATLLGRPILASESEEKP